MAIYFLFGKTGAGKSHVGELLKTHGVRHIDGDDFITAKMKQCLTEDIQMTPELIDEFVVVLGDVIASTKEKYPGMPFIISQALYLDSHRCQLLAQHPDLSFVHVQTSQVIREARINERYRCGKSKVTVAYAKEMDTFFENPSHPVLELENDDLSPVILLDKLQRLMPDVFIKEQAATKSLPSYCALAVCS